MQAVRLNKIATRVVLLQTTPEGAVTPVTVYKKKRKKKSSRGLRAPETVMKRLTDAQRAFADSFSNRFRSSRRKKRDGWLRDLGSNLFKAVDKGRKRLRLDRIPS
ncbi:MAG: hypothetical protein L0Z62_21705 [Gemmataceae bacterium]|nr:hypothetical protein [Gemmataceae bacterium]